MKNPFCHLLLIVFVAIQFFSCQDGSTTTTMETEAIVPVMEEMDIDAEKDAIKKLVLLESNAFYNHRYEEWAAYYDQGVDMKVRGWNKNMGTMSFDGWSEFAAGVKEYMEENDGTGDVTQRNLEYKISDDMALVTFDQIAVDGNSREVRLLEKRDGKWRITYLGFLHDDAITE